MQRKGEQRMQENRKIGKQKQTKEKKNYNERKPIHPFKRHKST